MIQSFRHGKEKVYFPFIVKISDRVPHLEYFTLCGYNPWKRVGKEWVSCYEAGTPSYKP